MEAIRYKPSGVICPDCGKEMQLALLMGNSLQIPMPCECLKVRGREARAALLERGRTATRDLWRKEANMPVRWAAYRFDSITPRQGQAPAYNICKKYAEQFYKNQTPKYTRVESAVLSESVMTINYKITQDGLIIAGGVGCGKTMLAAAIANAVIDSTAITDYDAEQAANGTMPLHGWTPARITSIVDLLARIKQGYDTGDAHNILAKYQAARLLILDDLGAERPTEWTVGQLTEVIDYRYTRGLPTIVTTNCSPQEMRDRIGARIVDRLKEVCDMVLITAPSQRGT